MVRLARMNKRIRDTGIAARVGRDNAALDSVTLVYYTENSAPMRLSDGCMQRLISVFVEGGV